MPRTAKHPKLPNGFGSIKKLSGNRTNPYAVYPPTTEFAPNGSPKTPKAICYVSDWYMGFYALMEYRAGTFSPENLACPRLRETEKKQDVVSKIIASYNRQARGATGNQSFAEVYAEFFAYKYERDKTRAYSKSSIGATKAAYSQAAALHDMPFRSIRTEDLQSVIDNCPKKHATKEHILNLFRQMYDYAFAHDQCDRKYSDHVRINTPDDDEKGEPLTEQELALIWEHADGNEVLQAVLIMIYSGFRISAYRKLEVNMEERFFRGGVKTAAGKNRIVPFNREIIPFIQDGNRLFTMSAGSFRPLFHAALAEIGITGHTPHDCRHTFSWLCDRYHVDTLSKKMLMGHSLGTDVTDQKYGHRTLDELRTVINKLGR